MAPFYIAADFNCELKQMDYVLCEDNNLSCTRYTAKHGEQFWAETKIIIKEMSRKYPTIKDVAIIIQNFSIHGAVFLLNGLSNDKSDDVNVLRRSNEKNSFVFLSRKFNGILVRCFDSKNFISNRLKKILLQERCSPQPNSRIQQLKEWLDGFRRIIMKSYHYDPFKNYTLNVFTFNRMKEIIDIDLKDLENREVSDYFTDKVRPGVVSCNKRIVKIEDPSKEWIIHLDANNLAGWAMSDYLPDKDMFLEANLDLYDTKDKIMNLAKSSKDYGFILEVDLDYPEDLYDDHDDLPFCPEYKQLDSNLSEQTFVACLGNKRNYVIHYKYLQLALSSGLTLVRVHKVWKFHQSRWLKKYIDHNTKLRNNTNDAFEKSLFKQMNNSLVGKFSTQKRIQSPLAGSWEKVCQLRNMHELDKHVDRHIINENLCLFEFSVDSFDTYAIIAFVINDLMKYKMYKFHYNCMRQKYGDKLTLLYTETDSFIYQIETDNFYRDLIHDDDMRNNYFDTTGLMEKRQVQEANLKELGKMKDEQQGVRILEFLGTGVKYYYLTLENSTEPFKKIAQASIQDKNRINKSHFEESILESKIYKIKEQVFRISGNFDIVKHEKTVDILKFDGKRKLNDADPTTTKAFRFNN